MNVISPQATTASSRPDERDTDLHGPWLLIGRAGWLALALLVLVLSTLAIPGAYSTLQSLCEPGVRCVAVQLTPYDLRLLRQIGLTPSFLAVYQVGWDVATVLIYTTLAALIFWRRSQERFPLFGAFALVLFGGATYTELLADGLRTQTPVWYWPIQILYFLGLLSFLTFFLLFPRGRFVPRWTRWWVLVAALAEAHYVFITDPLQASKSHNPSDFLLFAALVFSLVGIQGYRYWRVSTFRERQQTKWVVFGFGLAIVGAVVSFSVPHLLFQRQLVESSVFQVLVLSTMTNGILLLIPIAIAIAILRSQLYDIDVVINRTLVYGSLSAVLAAVYFACVIGVQAIIQALTGSPNTAPVLIVASTLVVAALFNPLRHHIQATIDRRFYRRKYDATETIAAFGATLRTETDLSSLSKHLVSVVDETMQPAHIGLWLRQPKRLLQSKEK